MLADLGDDVDYVLDGGPCPVGVESTIVDVTTDPPTVLRPGGIAVETLERVLDRELVRTASGPARASGMMASHYAPRCAVEVVEDRSAGEGRVATLTAAGRRADLLDPTGDVVGYAHHLYGWLRAADDRDLDVVVAVLPPGEGSAGPFATGCSRPPLPVPPPKTPAEGSTAPDDPPAIDRPPPTR